MNKGITYMAIKNRKITLFVTIIAAIFGMYSFYAIPKQESPNITTPFAVISTVYPGASPEDIEKLITRKIEDEVAEIPGFSYSTSDSRSGIAIVVVRLDNDADTDKSWSELRRKMEDLQPKLPEGCEKISINTDLASTAGIIISMSGENYTYEELYSYAEEFKNELNKIEGVSRFDITGKQEKEVLVKVDFRKLNYHNLSLQDIANIVKMQNIEIPSGHIRDGNIKTNVKTDGTFSSIDELKNTIIGISQENGALLRLKDIAGVQMQLEDSSYRIKQNGENAVLLTGYFKENKNIMLIGKKVESRINELKSALPEDIIFDQVLFQPDDVGKSVNSFTFNLLEGMLLVIVVVFIGMSIRNAAIISLAIPLSMTLTFCAMNIMGIEIHQISIMALIVALGMLVDNAIVISDAIQVRIDLGQDKLEACTQGAREVAIPVFTSTLTTVAAFIPLLLLPSVAGEYVRSVPQIIMLSLSFSFIVAMVFTPVMAYMFFQKSNDKSKNYRFRHFFSRTLKLALKYKGRTVAAGMLTLVLTAVMAYYLGLQFFPKADNDIIYIDVKAENSTDILNTERIGDEVADVLKKQPETKYYTAAIGDSLPKFYISLPPYTRSQDFAQIFIRVNLKEGNRFKNNSQFADYLQEILDSKITGGTAEVKLLEQGEPIGAPVRIRVNGNEIRGVYKAAMKIEQALLEIEGTVNVGNDYNKEVYEFYVDINTNEASSAGISRFDVQREVNIALMGMPASVYRQKGNEYDIRVKSDITTKEELENLAVKSSVTGGKTLLKQIAVVGLKPQTTSVKKYNKDLTVTVYSDVKSGYSSAKIQGALKEKLKGMDLDGANAVFDGEREKIFDYFGDIGISAIFAVVLVYVILLVQFGSLVKPLIILLTIPLSVFGSVFGLLLFKQPLSFMSLFGMASLVGIVVNNAIILVDYINSERDKGRSIDEACANAAEKRFRPIMLTTITTVVGLMPLLFSGSNLFKPMSISLMFGLMVSTLLTLVIIPVVYSIIETPFERRKLSNGINFSSE